MTPRLSTSWLVYLQTIIMDMRLGRIRPVLSKPPEEKSQLELSSITSDLCRSSSLLKGLTKGKSLNVKQNLPRQLYFSVIHGYEQSFVCTKLTFNQRNTEVANVAWCQPHEVVLYVIMLQRFSFLQFVSQLQKHIHVHVCFPTFKITSYPSDL